MDEIVLSFPGHPDRELTDLPPRRPSTPLAYFRPLWPSDPPVQARESHEPPAWVAQSH